MGKSFYHKTIHKIAHHSSSDTGNAQASPVAKLRGRVRRAGACLPFRFPIPSSDTMRSAEKLTCPSRNPSLPLRTSIALRATATGGHLTATTPKRPERLMVASNLLLAVRGAYLALLIFSSRWKKNATATRPTIYVRSSRYKKKCMNVLSYCVAVFCICAQSHAAKAQEDREGTPIQIFSPERGDGIALANELDLHVRAALEGIYDSNIYETPDPQRSDFIAVFRPAVQLVTKLPRHEFRIDADAEIRRYAKLGGENSEQFGVVATGLLELGGRIDVVPEAGYARRIERRGTAGDQFLTDSPVAFDEKHVGLKLSRNGGTLEMRLAGTIYKHDYRDTTFAGVPVDLSSRNVQVRRASIRMDYRTGEAIRIFVEMNGNQVRYDESPGVSRDSSGYGVVAGVRVEIAKLVNAEAGVGYIRQTFDAAAFRPVSGINYWISAEWTPTPYWQVTAKGNKQVEPSPRNDTPAIVRNTVSLDIKRAIGNRLLLDASAGTMSETYWQIPRHDRVYFVSFSSHYRLAEAIGIVAAAGYHKRNSSADVNSNYEGFDIRLGVIATW